MTYDLEREASLIDL